MLATQPERLMAPVIRPLALVIVYLVSAGSLAIDVFQDFMDFQHPAAEVTVMEPSKNFPIPF